MSLYILPDKETFEIAPDYKGHAIVGVEKVVEKILHTVGYFAGVNAVYDSARPITDEMLIKWAQSENNWSFNGETGTLTCIKKPSDYLKERMK